MTQEAYTYAKAGVSIAAGNALVRAIGPLAKSTRRAGADADLGGFGGMFDGGGATQVIDTEPLPVPPPPWVLTAPVSPPT